MQEASCEKKAPRLFSQTRGFSNLKDFFSRVWNVSMRPASPMVRRKRDFFEWEFTKKMNAVGL